MVVSFQKEKWVTGERMEEELLIVCPFYTSHSMYVCSKNNLLKRETDVLHDRLLPTSADRSLVLASRFLTQLPWVPKSSPPLAVPLLGTLSPSSLRCAQMRPMKPPFLYHLFPKPFLGF